MGRRQNVAGWDVWTSEMIRSVIQTNVQSQVERLPRRVDNMATLMVFCPIQLLCRLLY